jgi:hypothetical protein
MPEDLPQSADLGPRDSVLFQSSHEILDFQALPEALPEVYYRKATPETTP